MLPSKGNMSDAADVYSSNDVSHSEFAPEEHRQQTEDGNTAEFQTEEETGAVRTEIRSIYQRLLDGKDRFAATDETNEFKNILTEAKNLIRRVKGTQGAIEDVEMFCLLYRTVKEVSEDFNFNEQKFHFEEYAHKLSRKFNFSTENSGNIIVTKLQVVSLGKAISKYFSRAPTIKFVLGVLDAEEGEMTANISDLPNELLRYIFLKLSLEDRKMAVLVSAWWRKVGEDPILWKWSVITICNGEDINKLSVKRIHHVQKISVDPLFDWQTQQLEELFEATLELPKLKEIEDLQYANVCSVNPELLRRALVKLEKLFLYNNSLTTNDQRVAIFKEMADNCLLKTLTLHRIDLRTLELDAGELARAMSGMHKLMLASVYLTNHQTRNLFQSLSENNQLNEVHFSSTNLSSVGPEIFGAALAKMEMIRLSRTALSPVQARALFAEIGPNSRIKSITITEGDLSSVDPKLFSRVLWKLDKVSLISSNLTNEQLRDLFTVLKQNCKINLLDLTDNDLSLVDPDDLATVVTNIEDVSLADSLLNTDQITAVLTRALENSKLEKLSIMGNRMSEVEPGIVNRAKEILVELDIDSESEYEDDEGEEEYGDEEEEEEYGDDEEEEDSLDGFIASESDGEEESDGGN